MEFKNCDSMLNLLLDATPKIECQCETTSPSRTGSKILTLLCVPRSKFPVATVGHDARDTSSVDDFLHRPMCD